MTPKKRNPSPRKPRASEPLKKIVEFAETTEDQQKKLIGLLQNQTSCARSSLTCLIEAVQSNSALPETAELLSSELLGMAILTTSMSVLAKMWIYISKGYDLTSSDMEDAVRVMEGELCHPVKIGWDFAD